MLLSSLLIMTKLRFYRFMELPFHPYNLLPTIHLVIFGIS
jgi:hypothetical protein